MKKRKERSRKHKASSKESILCRHPAASFLSFLINFFEATKPVCFGPKAFEKLPDVFEPVSFFFKPTFRPEVVLVSLKEAPNVRRRCL